MIVASPPREEHRQTSDLAQVLKAVDGLVDRRVPIPAMRKIPGELRKQRGELTITTFDGRIIDVEAGDTSEHAYGMAFDIGTTSIVGTLLHLESGEELAAVGSVNPQTVYGGDLMSRIAYAQFDEKKLVALRAKVLNAINGFVKDACRTAGVSSEHLYKIVVVGNTCMHHIFLGVDVTFVGLAPYAPAVSDGIVVSAGELPLKSAPNAQVCLLPIVAGFVGADTMACVLATRIYESEELRALVDIGTNGEVVMGSKERLMACSAPAGPALEGAQIRHGMRGAMGAIEAVTIGDDVQCSVIGSARAIGICGSGLIDACAKMVGAGVINGTGRLGPADRGPLPAALAARLRTAASGVEFVLVWDADAGKNEDVTLTQGDIRQLQLAKSAIYSGIVLLQRVMGIGDADLAELMLCGGFGNYINTESAVAIRLLPDVDLDRITYVGNAAHLGAQMALLSERERLRAEELAQRIEHVALAARPDFQDIFIDGMSFESPHPVEPEPVTADADTAKEGHGMSDLRINLLFGFLGSGKTTLVRRILERARRRAEDGGHRERVRRGRCRRRGHRGQQREPRRAHLRLPVLHAARIADERGGGVAREGRGGADRGGGDGCRVPRRHAGGPERLEARARARRRPAGDRGRRPEVHAPAADAGRVLRGAGRERGRAGAEQDRSGDARRARRGEGRGAGDQPRRTCCCSPSRATPTSHCCSTVPRASCWRRCGRRRPACLATSTRAPAVTATVTAHGHDHHHDHGHGHDHACAGDHAHDHGHTHAPAESFVMDASGPTSRART